MYFFDVVSLSAGFIRPASTVSEIIREAMDESFLFNSLSYRLVIDSLSILIHQARMLVAS